MERSFVHLLPESLGGGIEGGDDLCHLAEDGREDDHTEQLLQDEKDPLPVGVRLEGRGSSALVEVKQLRSNSTTTYLEAGRLQQADEGVVEVEAMLSQLRANSNLQGDKTVVVHVT